MSYRRRTSTFETMVNAITRSQGAALSFAALGAALVSPLPKMLISSVDVGGMTNDPYAGMIGSAYVAAARYLLPIVRAFGFLLLAMSAGSLLFNGRHAAFRTTLRTHGANIAAALAIIAVFVVIGFIDPPRFMSVGGRTPATSSSLPASMQTPPRGGAFPENGTVRWGDEGQPIGGNLERFEIWDVTQSPESKVVAIRNGLTPDYPGVRTTPYATVYMAPGQRISLMLPAGIPYHVTAMAGTTWEGGDALFGATATTVDFGHTMLMSGRPQIIAMGAPDQTASIVPNNRF